MTPAHFIFLYGPPASGKTVTGLRLAESLHLPFYDLDEVIETQAGSSIPQIFAAEGEAGFRERESGGSEGFAELAALVWWRWAVGLCCARKTASMAEDSGDSGVSFSRFRDHLAAPGRRRWRATVAGGRSSRPACASCCEQRDRHYASFRLQVESDHRSVDQAAWQAQVCLGMFRVEGMGAGYDVLVRNGGLNGLGLALRERKLQGPLALVSDQNVAAAVCRAGAAFAACCGLQRSAGGDPCRRAAQDAGDCQPVVGILPACRCGARRHGHRAGRWGGRRSGRVCRGGLSARGALGSAANFAAGNGGRQPGRQDRLRPAAGQEPGRRFPPAQPGAGGPAGVEDFARGRAA